MNKTIKFVLIAYSITWLILFPLSFYYNSLPIITRELWHSLGALGPTIGALFVIKNKKKLINRLTKYSGLKNLLFSLFPLIVLIIVIIGFLPFNQFLSDNKLLTISGLISFFIPSLFYGFFEEIGWRGYLLPSLQKKHNPLIATIILTIIWMLWHLPMFFYRFYNEGFTPSILSLLSFFLLMLSGSLVLTFLYNKSKGSILMLILLHISYDITTSNKTGPATIIVSVIYMILDLFIIYYYLKNKKYNKETEI